MNAGKRDGANAGAALHMKEEALAIRAYEARDRDAVIEITRLAWGGVTMAELRERRFGPIGDLPWQDQKVAAVVATCDRAPERVLVAECEGRVIGYATFAVTLGGGVGVVGNNAVHPTYQRRGVGTALIRRVVETLEEAGVRVLELTTFEHDTPARRVYERNGFEELARSVHYVRPAQRAQRG